MDSSGLRALAACLAFALAGCSGGDGGQGDGEADHCDDGHVDAECPAPSGHDGHGNMTEDPTADDPPTEDGAPEPPADPRAPVTWEVGIYGNAFHPAALTVQAGDTVRWVHTDGVTPHTVTADGGEFDSGPCPGPACLVEAPMLDTFEYETAAPGNLTYHCEVHASMVASLEVLAFYNQTP